MSRLQTNAIRHLGSVVDNMTLDNLGRVLKPQQPAFRATGSSAYSVRPVPVNFDTVIFNTGGHYNASTFRFTAPVAGIYWFGTYGIGESTSAQGGLNLRVNGVSDTRSYNSPNERTRGITGIFRLNAGDYVEVGTEDLSTYYLGSYGYFAGYFLG